MISFTSASLNRIETHNKINSTMFPRLMFSSAPIVSPVSLAILSVASVSKADKGTMAMALQMKVKIGLLSHIYVNTPIGTKTRRALSHVDNTISFREPKKVVRFPNRAPSWSGDSGSSARRPVSASGTRDHFFLLKPPTARSHRLESIGTLPK